MPANKQQFDPAVLARFKEVSLARAKRPIESIRLYEPLYPDYHACRATEVLVTGGNRSGKSLATFCEDARAVLACDPEDKYPKRDGILCIVAQNWKQIGMVVYPMLFKPGAFKIIKDRQTGAWRSFRPSEDRGRESETKPAPPLIPKRMLDGEPSFINKRERHLSSFKLTTGWECFVFSSDGEVPMGFQADRIHFDEDIRNPEWVGEMQARLSDRKGVLHWSATPTSGNDAMMDMADRAEIQHQEGRQHPDVVRFQFKFMDNPYIDADEKRKRIEGWASQGEDVLAKRAEGELIGSRTLVFPNFCQQNHMLPRTAMPQEPPSDWTRYAYIDPGHDTCAVLFIAVPPDDNFVLAYDELYLHNCDARKFAEAMATKTSRHRFRAFVFDMHGGRLRDIGGGETVATHYRRELAKRNVKSETTGSGFFPAVDKVERRIEAARLWLYALDGPPRFKYLEHAVPNFLWEMRRYRKKVDQRGTVEDKPNDRGPVHLCQCFQYAAAHSPRYVVPQPKMPGGPNLLTYLRDKAKRRGETAGSIVLN